MTIVTRVGWCEECAKQHRPKTGDFFLVYGFAHHSFHMEVAERYGRVGFTPHIYKLDKNLGENVTVLKSCAMYGCGVDRKWDINEYWFYFVKAYKKEIWETKQWNGLLTLERDRQYMI